MLGKATKGHSTLYNRNGGFNRANKDSDKLKL